MKRDNIDFKTDEPDNLARPDDIEFEDLSLMERRKQRREPLEVYYRTLRREQKNRKECEK